MAKQNFIAGGYYGKLGQTVGQRWKNKRTIHAYTISANPRTNKQQANRIRFGGYAEYSQLGMSANFNAEVFLKDYITEWNYRVSTCASLYEQGNRGLNLIPLAPINFIAPYSISSAILKDNPQQSPCRVDIQGNLPAESRKLSAIIEYFTTPTTSEGFLIYDAFLDGIDNSILYINITDGKVLNSNCKIRLVSKDDVTSSNDMILSKALQLSSAEKPIVDLDTTINNVSISGENISFTLNQEYIEGEMSYLNISVRGVENAQYKTDTLTNITLTQNGNKLQLNGKMANYNAATPIAFPSNSFLHIENIEIETSTTIYTASDTTSNFTAGSLNRTYKATATMQTGDAIASYKIQIQLPTTLASFTWDTTKNIQREVRKLDWGKTVISESLKQNSYSNGTLTLSPPVVNKYVSDEECNVTIPTFSFEVYGVTYEVPPITVKGSTYHRVLYGTVDFESVRGVTIDETTINLSVEWTYSDYGFTDAEFSGYCYSNGTTGTNIAPTVCIYQGYVEGQLYYFRATGEIETNASNGIVETQQEATDPYTTPEWEPDLDAEDLVWSASADKNMYYKIIKNGKPYAVAWS